MMASNITQMVFRRDIYIYLYFTKHGSSSMKNRYHNIQ